MSIVFETKYAGTGYSITWKHFNGFKKSFDVHAIELIIHSASWLAMKRI